jgi:hypothetical protein
MQSGRMKRHGGITKPFQSLIKEYELYILTPPVSAPGFEKRLTNFIAKTRENKLIIGYGGIEKYYN